MANAADNPTPNVRDTVNFTVTVTVTDLGPDQATGVTVTDQLPPGLSFASASPSTGSYDAATGAWTVGTVSTSTPQTLILTAVVDTIGQQTIIATITHPTSQTRTQPTTPPASRSTKSQAPRPSARPPPAAGQRGLRQSRRRRRSGRRSWPFRLLLPAR